MTEQLPQDTALRYLLQDLQGADLRDLEEQLIEDADVQEQVAAVEAELIDDYVSGRLSPAVRARFETHYLADPEASRKVEFARRLREELSRTVTRAPRTAPRQFPRWMGAAAMLAMAVLTATSAWWAWTMRQELTATRARLLASSRRAEELSARLAAAEQSQPEDAPTALPAAESPLPLPRLHRGRLQTAMFLLAPGVSRAPGPGQTVVAVPAGAGSFQLALQWPVEPGTVYRAVMMTPDGTAVSSTTSLRPERRGASTVLVWTVDSSRTPAGDYVIRLSARQADGGWTDLADYSFRLKHIEG